jgi:hypothetical protein
MAYFQTQNPNFGKLPMEGLVMEGDDIYYSHLVYFRAIWYIFWSFGIFFYFGAL